MVYETFQETITTKLRERLGDEYRLLLQKIPKNNGLTLNGLSISPRDQAVAPTVYLNQYYEQFQNGRPLDALADEIVSVYRANSAVTHTDFSMLEDFSGLRDKVVYRLVHTLSNQKLLEDVPSVPYLDLSIVFYLYLKQGPLRQMTALIHNRHMRMWNTSPEELYALACANTQRLMPAELKTMAQVIKDMAKEHLGKDYQEDLMEKILPRHEDAPMFVLTNSVGLHGAAAMLYPCALKGAADSFQKDLVILPSSIHEVLLIPYEDSLDFRELSDMVININREHVPLEDRLSNHVYFYSRLLNKVTAVPGCSSSHVS